MTAIAAPALGSVGSALALGVGLAALAAAFFILVATRRSNRRLIHGLQRIQEDTAVRVDAAARDRSALETLLAALDDGIVMFGTDGTVLYRNPAADRLLHRVVDHVSELAPSELLGFVAGALAGELRPPLDVTMGPTSILGAVAVRLPAGQLMLALRDVTPTRRLDAVRRDFVANASHELKTPIASIQALAETMADATTQDPPSVPRFAEQLRVEIERLTRVVSDLLDLSRLEGGPAVTASVRLDQLAQEETERLTERARREGLDLDVKSEPLLVAGSERDLRLLVRNLVENALQYTGSGGRIEVDIHGEDGRAVLRVSDTGIGIPSRDRDRVFERFYRVDRARSRETGGTGLGLSIVKHVAENHRGTVSVDSELGRGSTFTVRLPLSLPEPKGSVKKPS
jgi:two-component system, OmpR family, sensor histidine kinase SenX3